MSKSDIDTPVDEKLLRGEEEVEVEETETEETPAEEVEKADIEKEEDAAEEATEATDAKEEDKTSKEKPGFVSQERFNQVYAELKQLKEQDAKATTTVEAVETEKPIDIKALRKEANEAFFDGDLDRHAQLQEKIDDEILRRAEETAEKRYTARQAETSFAQKATEMTEKYPVLRDGTGNQDAIDMVINMRDAYMAKGMTPAQALQTAADKVAPLFTKAEPATTAAEKTADVRTLKAVERGVKTNEATPPQTTGVGNRAQTINEAGEISQEDWNKLSPAEREKRLAA